MENLQKIAMLIDADNTQLAKLEAVIQEVNTLGRIVVKRAYGNWKKDALKRWEGEIKRLAIKPEQQFDYVSGKNATDMALVIDTIELLHRELYDAFVIVASDSDYTPLALHLREQGVHVVGVGEKKTPEAFRKSCDEFIYLENLGTPAAVAAAAPVKARPETKTGKGKKTRKTKAEEEAVAKAEDINEIHMLLRTAWDKYQDEDGYAYVSSAGQFLKRAKPDFDARTYGYSKLSVLISAFPKKYRTKKEVGKAAGAILSYQCID
ncbi:MAG: NYN domain-containing protein [Oscillospiraceae bacterium]|nr:NYN domain-containing protein [Oscillospiraceae bacterium]